MGYGSLVARSRRRPLKFTIQKRVPHHALRNHVPRILHARLPPTPPQNGCYTLIVFPVGRGVIHSGLAAKAVRRLPEDLPCTLLAVGAEFTAEAYDVLRSRGASFVTQRDYHWTDESHGWIRVLIGAKVKKPQIRNTTMQPRTSDMNDRSRIDPPARYTQDQLIDTWLRHAAVHDHAMNVDRFARYAPEVGWASILAVLELAGARPHLWLLERPLCMVISQYGEAFIDRIEAEAARSEVFRQCLGNVQPDPVFRIPEPLWERLTHAAGTTIGPMSARTTALHTEFPDLAETLALDLEPLDPSDAPDLGVEELHTQALGWVEFHETFWAWVELNRMLEEEGPEAAWPTVVALAEQADDDAMPSLGAGALEDILRRHGAEMIDRVEARAAADRRFRFCLSHVWKGEMPDEIWARVVVARGDEPQRG